MTNRGWRHLYRQINVWVRLTAANSKRQLPRTSTTEYRLLTPLLLPQAKPWYSCKYVKCLRLTHYCTYTHAPSSLSPLWEVSLHHFYICSTAPIILTVTDCRRIPANDLFYPSVTISATHLDDPDLAGVSLVLSLDMRHLAPSPLS